MSKIHPLVLDVDEALYGPRRHGGRHLARVLGCECEHCHAWRTDRAHYYYIASKEKAAA
jgi:hypothetical protein